ncbi:50S ribosomal protein L5 [Candidatus Bathyarchaeota archaeon]|nr:MAG: 50S ribosomal protein L5 [Candidatus Bathyarchaeota archaeon]
MQASETVTKTNPLLNIRIEKVTINIATGKSGEPLEKAKKVLNQLTNKTPTTKLAKKAIKDWGIRKGEPIATVVTLRREDASQFLTRALDAVSNKVNDSYVPELGIFGATVHVTLERPGYRLRRRSIRPAKIGKHHYVSKKEAIQFIQDNFRTQVGS